MERNGSAYRKGLKDGIPIAAGVLYLFGGPTLNPIFAAAAMSLSSVSVLTNALRLKRFKPDRKGEAYEK